MSAGNTVLEGLIILGLSGFFYIWAQNAEPLASIAQGVCNSPPTGQVGQSLLGQNAANTCAKINVNADMIISQAPVIAQLTGFLGIITVIVGVLQSFYSWRRRRDSYRYVGRSDK
jgi:hypothetical protein